MTRTKGNIGRVHNRKARKKEPEKLRRAKEREKVRERESDVRTSKNHLNIFFLLLLLLSGE